MGMRVWLLVGFRRGPRRSSGGLWWMYCGRIEEGRFSGRVVAPVRSYCREREREREGFKCESCGMLVTGHDIISCIRG
ncbi:hypothetical protein Hanom_Chr16g01494271 [Helianthus anomalus]